MLQVALLMVQEYVLIATNNLLNYHIIWKTNIFLNQLHALNVTKYLALSTKWGHTAAIIIENSEFLFLCLYENISLNYKLAVLIFRCNHISLSVAHKWRWCMSHLFQDYCFQSQEACGRYPLSRRISMSPLCQSFLQQE